MASKKEPREPGAAPPRRKGAPPPDPQMLELPVSYEESAAGAPPSLGQSFSARLRGSVRVSPRAAKTLLWLIYAAITTVAAGGTDAAIDGPLQVRKLICPEVRVDPQHAEKP